MVFIFKANNTKPGKLFYLYPIIAAIVLIVPTLFSKYYSELCLLGSFLILFIFPLVLINNIKKKVTLMSSFFIVGICTLINCLIFISTIIMQIPNSIGVIISYITYLLEIIAIICLVNNKSFLNMINIIFNLKARMRIVVIVFIWEIVLLEAVLNVLIYDFKDNKLFVIVYLLTILCFIFTFFILLSFIKSYVSSSYYKKVCSTFEENMETQVSFYDNISKTNKKLREFKHDYENLKIGLNAYLADNDIEGAKEYIDSCDNILDSNYIIYRTGHNILDALISYKANEVKKDKIEIVFNGVLPKGVLTPTDLCIVFGNTIDNAIEACLKLDRNIVKTIEINIRKAGDYLFISITNPVEKKVRIFNNTINTTKEDKDNHGIGLTSLKNIVDKYDGHIQLESTDSLFKISVDFAI
jgi:hypothetical protein